MFSCRWAWSGSCHRAMIHQRCKGNIWLNIPVAAVLTFRLILMHNNAGIKQILFSWRHSPNSWAALLRLPWRTSPPTKSRSVYLMIFSHCSFAQCWWFIHPRPLPLPHCDWKIGQILKHIDNSSKYGRFGSRCWKDPSRSIQTVV